MTSKYLDNSLLGCLIFFLPRKERRREMDRKTALRGTGVPSQQTLSIRNKHIACLETLLNFNNPVDSKTSWQESWKILIYDSQCRDVISTLFKVADLRKHGVTLHLNLHTERQAVHDVAALYLVEPSPENVQRIASDCVMGLYDSMYLNWSSSVSQEQLHALATAVAESDAAQRVSKVVDQYLDFISLDHSLFSLNMPDSFIALNDPQVSDADMERTIGKLVNSLFSVVVTLGVMPYIACPSGGAAGMVGEGLHSKLSEHLRSTNNLFKDQAFGCVWGGGVGGGGVRTRARLIFSMHIFIHTWYAYID